MATGISVDDACVEAFQELKIGHKHRFVIFKINDDHTAVEPLVNGDKDATWDDFCAQLPADSCRYAIFDFEFETNDGGKRNKITFVVWTPDVCRVKEKMLYAGTKDAVKKKLEGIQCEVQATDNSEIEYDVVKEKASRFDN
ncbi:actophorin [Thecamonas trahens ATCC 50062]|uniref:Actophorin n=1 Tax=Thecamonas trahens ATCC 50062 TaxID=461836 RepID=A0A0L0D0P4_THETB|nr:actophorin [Thecamonas trahens ATCC 50062]KNC45944.1 actophorin [Thecamonas trahens ATCC 50062]|eukprot:XP_013762927.1 actophorin [Thecamonas trahens ATCC 50062]